MKIRDEEHPIISFGNNSAPTDPETTPTRLFGPIEPGTLVFRFDNDSASLSILSKSCVLLSWLEEAW